MRPFLKHLPVPDHPVPVVMRDLEVLSELQCVHWAGILTQSTEHAARKVVGEVRQLLLAVFRPLPADHDQILRAGQRTQVAGDAEGLAGLRVVVEARGAAVALGDGRALEGVLLGIESVPATGC